MTWYIRQHILFLNKYLIYLQRIRPIQSLGLRYSRMNGHLKIIITFVVLYLYFLVSMSEIQSTYFSENGLCVNLSNNSTKIRETRWDNNPIKLRENFVIGSPAKKNTKINLNKTKMVHFPFDFYYVMYWCIFYKIEFPNLSQKIFYVKIFK